MTSTTPHPSSAVAATRSPSPEAPNWSWWTTPPCSETVSPIFCNWLALTSSLSSPHP